MIYNYDGININITKQGSGEPVFLLHGWGCTGDIFKSINQVLSTAYTTYSFDFPGFGASDDAEPPPAPAENLAGVRPDANQHCAEF